MPPWGVRAEKASGEVPFVRTILLNGQTELIKRLDISVESFSFYVKTDATKFINDLLG